MPSANETMADNPRSPSSNKSRTIRSQKIAPSSADGDSGNEAQDRAAAPTRSHTPGHLSSKSQGTSSSKRKASEPSIRSRSQSVSNKSAFAVPPPQSAPTPIPTLTLRRHGDYTTPIPSDPPVGSSSLDDGRRPVAMRSTSAIAGRATTASTGSGASGGSRKASAAPRPRGPHVPFPPLQDPKTAPDVPAAPSSGMYWSRAPVSGAPHTPLRAHTTTLIGSNVYVFGGCDSRACFNELYVLDADSFHWSSPHVSGDIPVPLRAMTCTAVGKKLVVFGGGDGPAYYNDVYVLDTVNFRWHLPRIVGDRTPSARRAHTACLYKNGIYMFGGGDGIRALNDIWRLDVTDVHKMSWKLVSSPSPTSSNGAAVKDTSRPKARGYHTANMVGSKLIIFGGSDGGECFNDVWVYDVDTHAWKAVHIPVTFRRLSHTSTIVGSYLFIVGGHDGNEYSNDVLLLNLVTMTWDKRRVYGLPPSGRGYHGTVLHDSRLIVIGGFDGGEVFSDVWILELAVHAYYSQISHFTIEV
ncbi:galactose oxidase [Daldinia loculata]|uniref:galactose oxidase n=1 Tax=Daldinia loculata TaxID=103429 RepID=UPI0020C4BC22|nr:galactose oxidase [Daldinia loculata]KAI1649972.1 galactose oxidase [Daldinia loculata]